MIGLADLPYTTTQDSLNATANTDGITDPAPVCDGGADFTVWYKLTTGSTPFTVRATTGLDDFPPLVNIYRLAGGSLVPAGCGGNSAVQLQASTTYYFMLSSFTERPTFSFTVQVVTRPANDSFATPTVIGLADLPYTTTQDSLNATANTDGITDPAPVCDAGGGFTVWYKLTTGSTPFTVRATTGLGEFFPPSVDVYRLAGGSLVPAGCGDNSAVQLQAGTTYYFMLSSFTERPTFSFTVQAEYVLQPLFKTDKAFNGSAAPIKVALVDPTGVNISAQSIRLTALDVVDANGTSRPAKAIGNASQEFVFDPSLTRGGGYRFDLDISQFTPGRYTLTVRIGAIPAGLATVQFGVG